MKLSITLACVLVALGMVTGYPLCSTYCFDSQGRWTCCGYTHVSMPNQQGITVFTQQKVSDACKPILSCATWDAMSNDLKTECTSEKQCLRSEWCCNNPCTGYKTCQRMQF